MLHQDTRSQRLKAKKASEVSFFFLEAICKKGGVFKYPKVFQCDNGSAFKSDVTKLLEKHDVDIRRTKTKYKHTNAAFVEVFNKELTKLFLSSWMLKSFRTPKSIGNMGQRSE